MNPRKIISKLSELPSAFSLEKYKDADAFQIQDWLVNLEFRALRHHTYQLLPSEVASGVNYVFAQPLLPDAVRKSYWQSTGMSKTVGNRQVHDQTVFDALAGHFYFDPQETRFTKYIEAFNAYNVDYSDIPETIREMVHTPMWRALDSAGIDDEGDVFVRVNLHASDDQLVADFANWVAATKKERLIDVPKRRVTPADLKEWARFKVLPYLDLTMWARANDCAISHQTIGLALFPDEFEVVLSDRVRKVIAPLARRLCTFEFCTSLRAQATAELESKHRDWVPAPWQQDEGPAGAPSEILPDQ